MRTKLDAVRWDGSNVAEIEAFAGRSPSVADEVLTVTDPSTGEAVRVNLGEWLVRADGRLRPLAGNPSAGDQATSEQRPADLDPERVEAVTDTLAFESGYD